MAMEWTREKTLALIQEYRKRRGLWDMTHEDYRKKDVKHKLLVEVGESLGGNIPIMEIEKKFHTLRTQYHREINRMKRKEPYNSKWFGFKCLQFLSSPKACRSNKGRIKAEITEEGTVTTKYIIREAIPVQHDNGGGSGNENEEFLTLPRRPAATITYEAVHAGSATSASSSRSHELEKLIEETTKDVEEIEEAKPKMTLKELTVPQHSDNYVHHAGTESELQITNVQTEHEDLHHIEDDNENMETINIQAASEEDISYQDNGVTNGNIGVSGANSSSTTTVRAIPARIIKIQRRDQNEYYEEQNILHHAQQQQQQQQQHQHQHHHHHHQQQQHSSPGTQQHYQTISPSSGGITSKRIYYDTSGHHTTTILTATPTQQQPNMAIINATSEAMTSPQTSKIHVRNSLTATAPAAHTPSGTSPPLSSSSIAVGGAGGSGSVLRDEYTTYGEYVANEMRSIKSREILIALKHKINTALFEANMQELQK